MSLRNVALTTLLIIFEAGTAYGDIASRLKQVVEASRVKMVWARCDSASGGSTMGFPQTGISLKEVLMRYDTETGICDTLFDGKVQNYQKSLITRNGKHIIYTTCPGFTEEASVYMVDWDKPEYPGTKIARGFGCCLWYDETSGKEYLLYTYRAAVSDMMPIYRKEIGADDEGSLLLDNNGKELIGSWVAVSSNAKYVVGVFGWPNVEGYDVATGEMLKQAYGCWATMSYDTLPWMLCLESEHKGWRVIDLVTEKVDDYSFNGLTLNNFKMASYAPGVAVCTNGSGSNAPGVIKVMRFNDDFTNAEDSVSLPPYNKWINGLVDLWTPQDPDVLFIGHDGGDTVTTGDTLTVKWCVNRQYARNCTGVVLRYSPDKGKNWSEGIYPIDGQPENEKPFVAVPFESEFFGACRYVIPDSIAVKINDTNEKRVSTVSGVGVLRIEDYGNTELPMAKCAPFAVAANPNSTGLRNGHPPRTTGTVTARQTGSESALFDIHGRKACRSTAGIGAAGIYILHDKTTGKTILHNVFGDDWSVREKGIIR